jgi:transcriptional/translational regulatory protein YebC/TACO1
VYEITCDPSAYDELVAALREKEIPMDVAELSMVPQTTIEITDADTARKILKLMEGIDDHDDVQNTYSNFDISEDIVASLS